MTSDVAGRRRGAVEELGLLCVVLALLAGCGRKAPPPPTTQAAATPATPASQPTTMSRDQADMVLMDDYHIDDHIEAAMRLQAFGKAEAIKILERMAARRGTRSHVRQKPVASGPLEVVEEIKGIDLLVLCRMLFAKREGKEFRAQHGLECIGGTTISDWPLAPAAIIDGVPFRIGEPCATIGGRPAEDSAYVNYCVANCDWSAYRFTPKTHDEMAAALRKLLDSPPLRGTLANSERDYLARQIEADDEAPATQSSN
ncbi:MAG: hypothetical protein NTW19_15305 [Planctomycetota bacterium]|nr:hypothetical protein [Planctomycetota bacterium]